MELHFLPMNREWARAVAGWRYPGALSVYNMIGAEEMPDKGYWAALQGAELVGFVCMGNEARVPGGVYPEDAADMGLGMRPDLVGRGLGKGFVSACLSFVEGQNPGLDVRLSVASFNKAAISAYVSAGFEYLYPFTTPGGAEFQVMRRDGRVYMEASRILHPDIPVYPGDPPFQMERVQIGEILVSQASLSLHTGTHLDAPLHYIPGAVGVEDAAPGLLCGYVQVLPAGCAVPHGVRRVFFKSGGVTLNQARTLAGQGVRLVGTEEMSIALPEEEEMVHRLLLSSGVWVLEGLTLNIPDGVYDGVVAPMYIRGAEGAPARVWLRRMRGV